MFKQSEDRLFESLNYYINFVTDLHLDMVTGMDTYFEAGQLFGKLLNLIEERSESTFAFNNFKVEIDLSIKLCKQMILPFINNYNPTQPRNLPKFMQKKTAKNQQ